MRRGIDAAGVGDEHSVEGRRGGGVSRRDGEKGELVWERRRSKGEGEVEQRMV